MMQEVHELNDDNYEEFINNNEVVFLKVYVPWCGHCKSLEKPYQQLSKYFKDENIVFAQANGEKSPKLKKRFQIHGYPQLILFIEGLDMHRQYYGPVDSTEPIKQFLREILEQEIIVYRKEYVDQHIQNDSYFGHGIYCGVKESKGYQQIHKASKLINNIKIFYEVHPEKCKEWDIKENQLAYFKKSNLKVIYDDFENFQKLKQFLNFARFDIINPFSIDVVGEAIGSKIPMLILFDTNQNRDFLSVLEELHQKIQFNLIIAHNKNKEEFEQHYLDIYGVDKFKLPELMIVLMGKKIVKFKYDGPFTTKSILKFVSDFLNHKLEQHLISENENTDHKQNKKLKKVTANGLRILLEDQQRDKIILFHTDSCHKCPESIQLIEEIAEELESENLYFGKFNVAKNESPQLSKIPSLVFFPKDSQQKLDYYQGGLDKELIKQFILKKHQRLEEIIKTDL